VAVELLAGPVVTHGGAWVWRPEGDLDVPEIHARIEHARDKRA
jgi:hypothetical protein